MHASRYIYLNRVKLRGWGWCATSLKGLRTTMKMALLITTSIFHLVCFSLFIPGDNINVLFFCENVLFMVPEQGMHFIVIDVF